MRTSPFAAATLFLFTTSPVLAADPEPTPSTPADSWFSPSQEPQPQAPPRARPKPAPTAVESASVKVTVQRSTGTTENTPPAIADKGADKPVEAPPRSDPLVDSRFLNGFRIGYAYTANDEKPVPSLGGKSF